MNQFGFYLLAREYIDEIDSLFEEIGSQEIIQILTNAPNLFDKYLYF